MSIIYDALKKAEDQDKTSPEAKQPVKRKSSIWVLAIICAAAIFLLISTRRSKINQAVKAKKAQDVSAVKTVAAPIMPKKEEKVLALDKLSIDSYVLEGIIYSPQNPLVIINGKILKNKDKIDDLEVVKINPNSVELRNLIDNTTLNLSLK